MTTFLIFIGSIALILIGYYGYLHSGQCPSCKQYKVAKVVNRELINSWETSKTKTVYDTHYDNDRNVTGRTKREIVVPIRVNKIQVNYKCTSCNHTWYVKHTEEEEL